MNTKFLLIRHGMCDSVGLKISGRTPGVHLNEEGRRQAKFLAERLKDFAVHSIYSSPLERTRETAEPLAKQFDLPVQISEAFNELDYGIWTGWTIDQLKQEQAWQQYHQFRSGFRIPGGEMAIEVQCRAIAELARLHRIHLNQNIAIFSHADVIRTTILHYLGAPVEFNLKLEISPASISVVQLDDWGVQVSRLNDTGFSF